METMETPRNPVLTGDMPTTVLNDAQLGLRLKLATLVR